jgi:hypothetical protein
MKQLEAVQPSEPRFDALVRDMSDKLRASHGWGLLFCDSMVSSFSSRSRSRRRVAADWSKALC